MEEEKAAAYYDELTRKGGGAARFKQGLGFAADSNSHHPKSSSSSSFLSNFVRASQSQSNSQISHSTPTKDNEIDLEIERHSQLENVRNKLTKKAKDPQSNAIDDVDNTNRPRVRVRNRDTRNRTETHKDRGRSRSPEKSRRRRSGGEERDSSRRRHRSPTKQRRRSRSRSRSRSRERKSKCNAPVDLIPGYQNMTPAERVKAYIRLQLSHAAHNDSNMGISSWERFHFDKDAPLDDPHFQATDDDAELVNQIGKTFRFTSLEGKREDQIKNAHDEAMFGVPAPNPSHTSQCEERKSDDDNAHTNHDHPSTSLMNEQVLSKQQGSWRDRARRNAA